MIRNYLLVALRHLRRQKGLAAINVFGLAIGLAGALLVGLFIRQELAFDRFHAQPEQVFRVWGEEDTPQGEHLVNTITPWVLGPTMAETLPDVAAFTRFQPTDGALRRGDDAFAQTLAIVDPGFLDVFSFPLVRGARSAALAQPNTIVITDEVARALFGDADPIGQVMTMRMRDRESDVTVTGVVHVPAASSLQFDVLVSFATLAGHERPQMFDNWFAISVETWVRLREGATPEAVEATLNPTIASRRVDERAGPYTAHLQPLLDVHLDATLPQGIARTRDPKTFWILGLIAGLVLAIACINFTTLALARSLERAREVGVRKALGAYRGQLMGQFWGEALLLTLFALLLGIGLTAAGLPLLSHVVEQPIVPRADVFMGLLLVAVLGVTALGAGAYPALALARFQPTETLRGRFRLGTGGRVQRVLVGVQFALSIGLVASTFVMTSQLRYLQTRDLGYAPDRVVRLPNVVPANAGVGGADVLRQAFERTASVAAVTAAAYSLQDAGALIYTDAQNTSRRFNFNTVAPNFTEALRIPVAEGTGFAPDTASAKRQVLVNRAFVEAFALTDPVGEPLPGPFLDYTIVGVTENFNFSSLRDPVGPLALFTDAHAARRAADGIWLVNNSSFDLFVRLGEGALPEQMALLERAFTATVPGQPFDYEFLDDALDAQYREDARLMQIVRFASGLAILIAALGLFGLAALTTAQRRKEIGVRKVLGASVTGLVLLLSKDLARLVLAGLVVAAPVAYWLMRGWLENFAYHIRLGPEWFVASGVVALAVALAATAVQAFRAATANPAKALRSE